LDDDPLTTASAELAPGERLVWADRPVPRRRRRLPLVLFGLLFTGLAAFWTLEAAAAGTGLALAGLVFVALGLAVTTSPLWRGRKTPPVYAITDRRLLVIRGGEIRRVRSFQPADIETLERRERADGTGDVVFGRETIDRSDVHLRRDGPPFYRTRQRKLGFFGIADVKRVEAAVRALRDGHEPPA
jgi:hypothetical protein